jgi:hypothetical protein
VTTGAWLLAIIAVWSLTMLGGALMLVKYWWEGARRGRHDEGEA